MSETTPTVEAPSEDTKVETPATEVTEVKPETAPPGKSLEDQLAEAKALSRKWEARAKENKTAQSSLLTTEERLASLEAENLQLKRNEVATKYKLPTALAARLTGKTTEELEADAIALSEIFKASGSQVKSQPIPSQGVHSDPTGQLSGAELQRYLKSQI